VVILSENEEFLSTACSKHLQAMAFIDYAGIVGDEKMIEVVANISDNASFTPRFSSHWSPLKVETELKSGNAHVGILNVDLDGQCRVHSVNVTHSNRGIHGDEVVVADGSVIAIKRRHWRPYVVTLSRNDGSRMNSTMKDHSTNVVCVPNDSRIPKIRVSTRNPTVLLGQRFVVRLFSI